FPSALCLSALSFACSHSGLIYPLKGQSWCTGPELVVARNLGAEIKVVDGYRVDWIVNSVRPFEEITRRIGAIKAAAKARGDTIRDKTAKEIGNSICGKISQAVASTRIIPDDIDERTVTCEQDQVAIIR